MNKSLFCDPHSDSRCWQKPCAQLHRLLATSAHAIPTTVDNHAIIHPSAEPDIFTTTVLHSDRPPPTDTSPHWHSCSCLFLRGVPADLSAWLLDVGSLTRRLRRACAGRFRVRILSQAWTRPDRDEAGVLNLRAGSWVWTREVHLLCNERPWVFARTLIPAQTLRGRGRRLTRLGTKPLGAVLFADSGVRRGSVEINRIVVGQRLHQRAFVGFAEPPNAIWGRRSVFQIDGCPLLVCEIFLPDLPLSPACRQMDFPSL